MNVVEKTGKTVEDAVQAALAELGVSREQVDVEVLEDGTPKSGSLSGKRFRQNRKQRLPLRKNQLKQRKPNRRQMTEAEILL